MNDKVRKLLAAQNYNGVPVVTFAQLTEILSVGSSTVRTYLCAHKDMFKEGVHYYKLGRQELLSVIREGVIPVNPTATSLSLLTEEGVKTYLSLKAASQQCKAFPGKQPTMNDELKKLFSTQQYNRVPVVTQAQATKILGLGRGTIYATINQNRDKFQKNVHYYKLFDEELLAVRQEGVIPVTDHTTSLLLLTEAGINFYLSYRKKPLKTAQPISQPVIVEEQPQLPQRVIYSEEPVITTAEESTQNTTVGQERSFVTISSTRCYVDENQVAWLNVEDVARGLGFTRTAASGNVVVRWERVNQYLREFGFVPTNGHEITAEDYIPENIFYRLAMKANNETAQVFQAKVADEILPTLRRTGSYKVPKKTIKEIEHDIKTIKGQEIVVHNLSSQVAIAQQRLDEAQRSLEQAKQNHLLELTVYQEMCKEHGVKPEPDIISSLTEDKDVVTLQYFYDKVKLQYPLLTMSKVYDLAVKQGYSLTGAFDRGRAEISKNDALSLYKAIQDQTITVENLISATTEQTKTTKDILQQLATTTRTIKEVIEVLSKKNIKTLADKNLNATNLISCLRSQKLAFSPAPKKKNYHSEDSTIPPATILALEHFLS